MVKRSYIKIYGPPILQAIRALERIAIEMPEVCIMDRIIELSGPIFDDVSRVFNYFSSIGEITRERCEKIISRSGASLGEYDFYFEWVTEPTMEQVKDLIRRIDEALSSLGCKYTITTK